MAGRIYCCIATDKGLVILNPVALILQVRVADVDASV
jgi:hypothetical protein